MISEHTTEVFIVELNHKIEFFKILFYFIINVEK